MKRILIILILLLPVLLKAQNKLTGTAYDADSRSKLKLVFVNNLTQKEVDHSGQKGDFSVIAELGDLIVFSCPGYQSDTLIVEDLTPKMVIMRISLIILDEVVVTAKAINKPENLRSTYSSAYSYASTNVLSADGKVSLVNAFSKQSQQKRAFQKFIDSELNEKLIDQKFNKQLVAQLTKVQGQLLEDFMSYYRPTYSMVATLNDVDLQTYIIESYNKYIRLPAEERIYPPLPKTSFGGR
jgi:antitoxin component YwqK of YwqJK toxin-antitoxin module